MITGASDKKIKAFDILRGTKPVNEMQTTDAVFCGEVIENLVVVGCGDGNVLSYDLDSGECLYGYGADTKGAVHCLAINED